MDISSLRQEYRQAELHRHNLCADPIDQFEIWFEQARVAEIPEVNAMVLATVSSGGQPMTRTVLLKYFDPRGFVFFTNYNSRKAQHIQANPQVSCLFLWLPLERQVQITGRAEQISPAESFRYFLSRPRESQIGAWCSQQSSIISSRSLLLKQFEAMKRKFQQGEIPLPEAWGGYRVVPDSLEFWQGRPHRLHDRFLYLLNARQEWEIQRLAP
ncbi:pyridoxamine 5'-phosphate oxidase [Lyngbya confervoides]|uniref:Pyridoxine/pyridoxamine 5'-phosphate oxidase n=1 Tax=Lyngbya confervoides BDU141951 TaxID=1574623 RepID=A0ABD4T3M9_9CYAN|nr:pyridoxamine 5'-phosphate oxidase [Lyngbya confervoides]MCM1983053.1 pyridoxamine 5'-phosphate oxidase [Lyngbya confervoides BDU141951]